MMNLPLPQRRFDDAHFKKKNVDLLNLMPTKKADQAKKPEDQLKMVALSELINPLIKAIEQSQPWVEDFGQEQIIVSADLHEVLNAFANLQMAKKRKPPTE